MTVVPRRFGAGPVQLRTGRTDEHRTDIETRKLEPGRVAANAVLVPLGVAVAFAGAYEGVDVWTDTWPWDPPGDAPSCVESARAGDDAAPPG